MMMIVRVVVVIVFAVMMVLVARMMMMVRVVSVGQMDIQLDPFDAGLGLAIDVKMVALEFQLLQIALQTAGIVLLYEAATIGTMIPLVLSARAGAVRLRLPFLDLWGDAVAGGVIVVTGVIVGLLGI